MSVLEKMLKDGKVAVVITGIQSAEDEHVMYAETPDGLRLRFRDGEYDGWYLP